MTNTPQSPPPDVVTSQAQYGEWRRALHLSKLTARTILLGLRLAEHVNARNNWTAWPSQVALAAETGTTVRRVRDRLTGADGLVTHGWVRIVSPATPHRSARYALSVERLHSSLSTGPDGAALTGPDGASEGSRNDRRKCPRNHSSTPDDGPASADASPAAPYVSPYLRGFTVTQS